MKEYIVARDVDRPLPLLMWEAQDFAIGMAFMMMGIILKKFLFGFVLFVAWMAFAKKMGASAKRGYLSHMTWFAGLRVDPALKNHAANPTHEEYMK